MVSERFIRAIKKSIFLFQPKIFVEPLFFFSTPNYLSYNFLAQHKFFIAELVLDPKFFHVQNFCITSILNMINPVWKHGGHSP